jgi:SAM-dependent methyltransferase
VNERVGKEYWDASWEAERGLPPAFDPQVGGIRGVFRRQLHAFFVDVLDDSRTDGGDLVEIGCGRSQLMPYFSKVLGFRVAGLDYSEVGCIKARRILERENVAGDIRHGDLFTYSFPLDRRFDVVFSFGLVEHFEDTSAVVRALARFARPGGVVLTLVPNMRGMVGLFQRLLNRRIYDIHVPLSPAALRAAHERAGLEVRRAGYLLPAHFGVVNPGTQGAAKGVGSLVRDAAYHAAIAASTGVLWWNETMTHVPESSLLSPYVFALARTPAPGR